jgi:hypothetical protein
MAAQGEERISRSKECPFFKRRRRFGVAMFDSVPCCISPSFLSRSRARVLLTHAMMMTGAHRDGEWWEFGMSSTPSRLCQGF